MTVRHLHREDAPKTLQILDALLGYRAGQVPGYSPAAEGARVDWEELDESFLSTTEKATLLIARGCSITEAHGGGLPPKVRPAVRAAIEALTADRDMDSLFAALVLSGEYRVVEDT
jgi:hypothetical protein